MSEKDFDIQQENELYEFKHQQRLRSTNKLY